MSKLLLLRALEALLVIILCVPLSCAERDFGSYKSVNSILKGNETVTVVPIPKGNFMGSLDWEQLQQYMEAVAEKNPHITKLSSIGLSYEKRKLLSLCLGRCNEGDDKKYPQTFYNAMHHSREPVSMMTLVYFIHYLLSGLDYRSLDHGILNLLSNRQLWFVPLVNPDGYVWNLHAKAGNLWQRKNRSPTCAREDWHTGVDLNRNYPVCFDKPGQGSSTKGCDEDYRGPHPFSEPETIAIRDFVASNNFTIAFNFHSFGHLMLLPYSCDTEHVESEVNEKYFWFYAYQLVYHSKYTVGRSYDKTIKLYPVNGDAADWMFKEHKIFAVSPEVGGNKFWVPEKDVVPLSKENTPMCHFGALASGPLLQIKEVSKEGKCFSFKVWNDGLWNTWGDNVRVLFRSRARNEDHSIDTNVTSIVSIPRIESKSGVSNEITFCTEINPLETPLVSINVGAADDNQCVVYQIDLNEFKNSDKVQQLEIFAKRSFPGVASCSFLGEGKSKDITSNTKGVEYLTPVSKGAVPGMYNGSVLAFSGMICLLIGVALGLAYTRCFRSSLDYKAVEVDNLEELDELVIENSKS